MSPEQQTPTPTPLRSSEWLLGEGFVRDVLRWSVIVAALGGVIGWLLTTEIAFALALWLGAAVDITTFRELDKRGLQAMQNEGDHRFPVVALLARLLAKGALLVIAALLPWPAAFWGMFAGVLVVEFMLVTVGIVRSIGISLHSGTGTGRGVRQ